MKRWTTAKQSIRINAATFFSRSSRQADDDDDDVIRFHDASVGKMPNFRNRTFPLLGVACMVRMRCFQMSPTAAAIDASSTWSASGPTIICHCVYGRRTQYTLVYLAADTYMMLIDRSCTTVYGRVHERNEPIVVKSRCLQLVTNLPGSWPRGKIKPRLHAWTYKSLLTK